MPYEYDQPYQSMYLFHRTRMHAPTPNAMGGDRYERVNPLADGYGNDEYYGLGSLTGSLAKCDVSGLISAISSKLRDLVINSVPGVNKIPFLDTVFPASLISDALKSAASSGLEKLITSVDVQATKIFLVDFNNYVAPGLSAAIAKIGIKIDPQTLTNTIGMGAYNAVMGYLSKCKASVAGPPTVPATGPCVGLSPTVCAGLLQQLSYLRSVIASLEALEDSGVTLTAAQDAQLDAAWKQEPIIAKQVGQPSLTTLAPSGGISTTKVLAVKSFVPLTPEATTAAAAAVPDSSVPLLIGGAAIAALVLFKIV